jgi:sRNA-binding protein
MPRGQGMLKLMAERYPRCFHLFPLHRWPLKVGIHIDLLHDLNGAISEKKINRFLGSYTSGVGYLRNSKKLGAWRYDLAGNHVGKVTRPAARHAKQRLAEIKADSAAAKKGTAEAAETGRPRLSLADLKRAALARKAAAAPIPKTAQNPS